MCVLIPGAQNWVNHMPYLWVHYTSGSWTVSFVCSSSVLFFCLPQAIIWISLRYIDDKQKEREVCTHIHTPIHICIYIGFIYLFLERQGKGGRERGRDTSMCGHLPHSPHWGPGLQPRYVPRLGTEPATLWLPAHAQPTELHQARLSTVVLRFSHTVLGRAFLLCLNGSLSFTIWFHHALCIYSSGDILSVCLPPLPWMML